MGAKLALWSATVLFPLPLVLLLNAELDDAFEMKFFISLGLIAYSWWLLGILLSVRPAWLDRIVGLPSIYALHGTLALFAIVPAFLHRENTFIPTPLPAILGDWAFYIMLIVVLHAILFLSGWLTDRSRLALKLKNMVEVVFRHQLTLWMHRLTIIIVIMIWLHVHLIERTNELFTFMTVFDFYTLGVLGIFAWKKCFAHDSYLTGTVTTNHALTPSAQQVSIDLDAPSGDSQPGDFYFLRFDDPTLGRERHPFSATDASQDQLTFTVRGTGDYTRRMGDLQTLTRVSLEGPYGRFDADVRDLDTDTPLVFIGMGAGVAPLLSLTDAYLGQRPIHLLWSVRNADDAFYSDRIRSYQDAGGGLFDATIQVGRFRLPQLQALLTDDQIQRGHFFVVGPNPAVLGMRRTLRQLRVPARRIVDERLTL